MNSVLNLNSDFYKKKIFIVKHIIIMCLHQKGISAFFNQL